MTREQVQAAVESYLRSEFGKLLTVRDVRRVHHVSSMGWKVRVVAPSRDGELEIAELEVDERGVLSPMLDPLGVIDILRATPAKGVAGEALDLGAFDPEPSLAADKPMQIY